MRYLARRKSNYSANDIRRLTLVNGVLIPEKFERGALRKPSADMAKDAVRRAIFQLASRGFYGNESSASPNYLPKLMQDYKLIYTASPGYRGSPSRS